MATRSQVLFYEQGYENPIVFYQHWDGYELPHIIADALDRAKKGGRLTDTPYLGRIIFSEMLRHSNHKGEEWNTALDETTGYGISFSQTEWVEWTVEIHSKYDSDPQIIVENYENEEAYSLEDFLDKYLLADGAFGWKSHIKEEVNA